MLNAVNGISLVLAVVANLFLLALTWRRLSFAIAQPFIIIGWYISSFLLIGLVAAVPAHLQVPQGGDPTFAQAYYYATLAAALYFILASMMVVTAWGVYMGRFSREYKLSMAQRTLMLQTIAFLGYLLAAAAVYSRIEDWDYLDAVYYVEVTLFTIGYGDFAPKTDLGRGLLFPMAIGGILFVGLIVGSIRTCVLEGSARKVTIRTLEKARERAMKRLDFHAGAVRVSHFKKRDVGKNVSSELERREQEFNIMRQVQQTASRHNRIIALSLSGGAWLFLWFVGAVVFWRAENVAQDWSYFESLYFTYVSFLTIGYGDFYPQDNSAKPAFVLWALIALPTLTVLIGAIGDSISEFVNTATLRIGESSILPDWGPLGALKHGAAEKKKGKGGKGGAFQEAKPPGFMSNEEGGDDQFDEKVDAEAVKGLRGSMEDTEGNQNAAGRHYRQYLLMKEMRNVVEHLDASPPRKYTYAEWTWFLKLLGQDESNAVQHRSPESVREDQGVREHYADAQGAIPESGGTVQPWSWLGHKSPLMSTIDEPKWVLQRLMATLEDELKARGDKHVKQEEGHAGGHDRVV